MKARILALIAEIKTIEGVIDNMSGPMRDYAYDELRNLRFELETLNRTEQRNNKAHLVINQPLEEPVF